MFDRDTLIIAYDTERGEPRGSRRKGVPSVLELPRLADGAFADGDPKQGDCIDCTICVQVCPTGIDIRDGLQYECIACGACVDACDSVMDKIGYPRGLVRYATLNSLEHKTPHVIRPRIIIYGLILLTLIGSFTYAVFNRTPLLVDVLRDRNALYRIATDGGVENAYTFKIVNKDVVAHHFAIRISEGGTDLTLHTHVDEIVVAAEGVAMSPSPFRRRQTRPAASVKSPLKCVRSTATCSARRSHVSSGRPDAAMSAAVRQPLFWLVVALPSVAILAGTWMILRARGATDVTPDTVLRIAQIQTTDERRDRRALELDVRATLDIDDRGIVLLSDATVNALRARYCNYSSCTPLMPLETPRTATVRRASLVHQ